MLENNSTLIWKDYVMCKYYNCILKAVCLIYVLIYGLCMSCKIMLDGSED